jgi:hypothetical protein
MSDPRCEGTRELAAELALGAADGEERGRALEHLATCPECRRVVDELAEVADGLLLLAPSREAPIGFESRALEPLGATRPRSRGRRVLAPLAAAAAAVAITLAVVSDDLRVASEYRDTLSEANGKSFQAASLYAPGEVHAGTVFGYQGSPSWMVVIVDPEHRAGVSAGDVVTEDGRRISLRPFALDPATGSWGRALPVDLRDVAVVRVQPAQGEALVAKLHGDD